MAGKRTLDKFSPETDLVDPGRKASRWFAAWLSQLYEVVAPRWSPFTILSLAPGLTPLYAQYRVFGDQNWIQVAFSFSSTGSGEVSIDPPFPAQIDLFGLLGAVIVSGTTKLGGICTLGNDGKLHISMASGAALPTGTITVLVDGYYRVA